MTDDAQPTPGGDANVTPPADSGGELQPPITRPHRGIVVPVGRKIFISYKREENDRARLVKKALEQEGYDVWFDEEVQTGKQWSQVIDDSLARAGCVVVLWSEAALASDWVRHEASKAMGWGRVCPLPFRAESRR